jgi:hypothetical protein
MTKFSPNESQRQAYLDDHFVYEARELNYCVMYMMSLQFHIGQQKNEIGRSVEGFFVNAGIEHFLLHARNLFEFYFKDDKPHLYARARLYVPTWRTPKKTDNIRELEKRVHGEITHLGWERLDVEPGGKRWLFVDLAIDLIDVTERFLQLLDVKYHSQTVRVLRAELSISKERYIQMKEVRGLTFPDLFSFLSARPDSPAELGMG